MAIHKGCPATGRGDLKVENTGGREDGMSVEWYTFGFVKNHLMLD